VTIIIFIIVFKPVCLIVTKYSINLGKSNLVIVQFSLIEKI